MNSTEAGRAPWAGLIMACAIVAALALPVSAAATRGLTTGFSDSNEFQDQPAQRGLWLDRTLAVGAGIVRLGVEWPAVAPNRPLDPTNPGSLSYDFSAIDGAVRDAEARGLKVLLSVNHAPAWAEGPNRSASAAPGTWMPNTPDVADFMQAVARRYSGNFIPPGSASALPEVQAIEVWDEPNSGDWLNPQFQGKSFAGADLYRAMLNASYKAIKSVNPRVQVVVGATDPYGDPPGGPYPSTGARARPVQFWQHVLCVNPVKSKKKSKKPVTRYVRTAGCSGPVMFDVFAHHPIDNTGSGPLAHGPSRYDASTPDLGRVVSVLRGAEKAGTTLPGKHAVWVTEFWWDSKPPNPVGAPLLTQARWIEQSLYFFWQAGASVAINFQLVDSSERPNVHAGFQSGIYFQDGRPKPSLTAFKFPFVTQRINGQKLQAWGKAPEGGKLLIQRRQGNRWVTVKKLQVRRGDVFVSTLSLRGKQLLRATVGSSTSLTWRQGVATTAGGGFSLPPIAPLVIVAGLVALVATAVVRRRQVVKRRRRDGGGRRARPVTG